MFSLLQYLDISVIDTPANFLLVGDYKMCIEEQSRVRLSLLVVGMTLWASFSFASSFMPSYWYYLVVRVLLSLGK